MISSIRKERKISQQDLATKSGISSTYLSRIETSKDDPTLGTLQRIGESLGIPLSVLFFYAMDENDIAEHKRPLFRIMNPTMKSLLDMLFITEGNIDVENKHS